MTGSIEAVPRMDKERWLMMPAPVWHGVANDVKDGWFGKVRQFYEREAIKEKKEVEIPEDWLTYDCAKFIEELGVPVGRFFTVEHILYKNRKPGVFREGNA